MFTSNSLQMIHVMLDSGKVMEHEHMKLYGNIEAKYKTLNSSMSLKQLEIIILSLLRHSPSGTGRTR